MFFLSFLGRQSKTSVDVSACLYPAKSGSDTSTSKSRIKSEDNKYLLGKNSSEANKSSADKVSNNSVINSGYNTDDHLYKQSINKLNSNQEESLLLLSSASSASTSTPAFDNQRNHNNSGSVVDSDNSSMHYSGASGTTSVISSLRPAYSDSFYSAGLHDHHHQHQGHPSVIQTTAMVASRMSPITPPLSMKYSNMELPSDMYHPAVASTPPYHDSMGDESPLHYSTLNNAINPHYSQIMLNNNNNNMTNNNTIYNCWPYDLPLNLRQKPDSVSPHNTIIKHEHIIDNRTITLDHHPETLHISSNESTAVAMRSNNNTGTANNFSVTNAAEGFHEHGGSHTLVDHNVLTEDHETEHHNYLTLTGPSEILTHQNIKDSPYHNNNNNNSVISANNNTTGNHNHSSSGESRSPNAYDGYDTGIHNSLTQLTPVARLYSPPSTDHPSVIQHGYFDSISPAR